MADLRAVNAQLREVIARQEMVLASQDRRLALQEEKIAVQAKLIHGQAELIEGQAKQLDGQAELIEGQAKQLGTQARLIEVLQAQVEELERRLGMDSSNSSSPPSRDGPAAKAEQQQRRRDQRGVAGREQGGQPGHPGHRLERVAVPDRVEPVEPLVCRGCGGGLAAAAGEVASSAQVVDIPPVVPTVTEYQMMRRVCPGCGTATTAAVPPGVSGPVCYGPNVRHAATLVAAEGHTSRERAAAMMAALLGTPVSTGFVSRCLARLGATLEQFEAVLVERLRAAEVLGTDETPVVVRGEGNHHIFTVRTDTLVWYGAADNRGHAALDGFGILPGYRGVLVRDDYSGYHKYDKDLAGVQLCCAHLLRDLQSVYDIDPAGQQWAEQVKQALQDAASHIAHAATTGADVDVDDSVIAKLRYRYDQGVLVGISTNLSRRWHKGNHPGLVLARRLRKKADQVWLFTRDLRVPWTNNASEQSLRMVKLQQKISNCWRSLTTAKTFCRIRSYLTTARNHGIRPLDAIRDALTGTPWMPPLIA